MAKSKKPPKDESDGDPLPGGQEHLPGMEPMPKNTKIHNLARRVKEASKEWSRAAEKHKDLKQNLTDAMVEAEIEFYHYGDVTVNLDTKRKLTVKVESDKPED